MNCRRWPTPSRVSLEIESLEVANSFVKITKVRCVEIAKGDETVKVKEMEGSPTNQEFGHQCSESS